ncbi:MAG: tetratricopeptide repeat protein [Chloroflexota bacterium]
MDTSKHLALFKQIAERSLDGWQRKLETRDEGYLRQLLPQQELLYQAVYKGFSFPELWEKSADVALAAFPLIERFSLSQQWLSLLEATLARCPSTDLWRRCQLLNRVGQFYCVMQTYEARKKALRLHEESLALAKQTKEPFLIATVYYQLAVDYFVDGNRGKAKNYAERALNSFQMTDASNQPLASTHDLIGQIYCQFGDFDLADQHLIQAIELFQQEGALIETARVMRSFGIRYYQTGDYTQAINYFEQALNSSSNRLDNIQCQLNIGASLFEMGLFKQAEEAFYEIDQAYLLKIGQTRLLAMLMQNIGNVLTEQEQYLEATPYIREAIDLWEQSRDQLRLANSIGTLGQCLLKQGQVEEGVSFLKEAIQILATFPGNSNAERWLQEFLEELKKEAEII